ncbi:MAG: hypothetical protein PHP01_03230 [Phycisphaerae bacterium]|nr:hypothetical protein [Phycisphaerae bacterium]
MAKTDSDKSVKKSFMTQGPTLHYSHANVNGCYALAMVIYLLAALFWSKLLFGVLVSADFPEHFYLERYIFSPLSIFEYPAQIFVLGLLIGIFTAVPIISAQLMSFKYSLVYVFILLLIVKLPGLALAVLIGSFAVASRPLRFRSRFIAIVLCTAPAILYFGFYGPIKNAESIRWAISFAPWFYGISNALMISGLAIAIGHFTRYRPGLIWSTAAVALVAAIIVFQSRISLAELDYQLYIAKNNPETIKEFHSHSITEALNHVVKSPQSRSYFQSPFYPEETIALRTVLKKEIQNRLLHDRWPEWFNVPDDLKYQAKKQQLLSQYENFINPPKQWFKPAFIHRALLKSKVRISRMPIALYYKAMLSELSPDLSALFENETLQFYNDYSHNENLPIWHRLFSEYPSSVESIEARKRRAIHLAGMEKFSYANQLIDQALVMVDNELNRPMPVGADEFEKIFRKPLATVITDVDLKKLRRELEYFHQLISSENLTGDAKTQHLLSQFILLNPHDRFFTAYLENLLSEAGETNPITDNIMLAQIMLLPDAILRQQKLGWLAKQYPGTDGGIQAKFEQACLKLAIWKEHNLSQAEKEKYLFEARQGLENFLKNHPKSIFAAQAAEKLAALPTPSPN